MMPVGRFCGFGFGFGFGFVFLVVVVHGGMGGVGFDMQQEEGKHLVNGGR